MTEFLDLPKTDGEIFELQMKAHDLFRSKTAAVDGAKILEIKTTDRRKEKTHPIDPPYLLVDTDVVSLSDSIIDLVRQYGRGETVSTVEVYFRHKDNEGEYYSEHLMSFHQPDGHAEDRRGETITITILGNVGLFKSHEVSEDKVHAEPAVVA